MILNEVVAFLHTWLEYIEMKYASEMKIEVLQDTDTFFCVIFETKNSIAELIVNDPYFAPYRFVSFQVMSVKEAPGAEMIFCYYDDDSSTMEKIVEQLNLGMKAAIHC